MRTRKIARLATIYQGSPGERLQKYIMPDIVKVTGDLVACPLCRGGVRSVIACFTDVELGIIYQKTRVYGRHQEGGRRCGKNGIPCPGSGGKVMGT